MTVELECLVEFVIVTGDKGYVTYPIDCVGGARHISNSLSAQNNKE